MQGNDATGITGTLCHAGYTRDKMGESLTTSLPYYGHQHHHEACLAYSIILHPCQMPEMRWYSCITWAHSMHVSSAALSLSFWVWLLLRGQGHSKDKAVMLPYLWDLAQAGQDLAVVTCFLAAWRQCRQDLICCLRVAITYWCLLD